MRRLIFLSVLLLLLVAASLFIGRASLASNNFHEIFWLIRVPRVLTVALCGMALSLAGAAMQGVFQNPLVGPEICGAVSGACLGGVLAIVFGFSLLGQTAFAFVFAFGAVGCAFALSRLAPNAGLLSLVLSGIIVSAFFGALVGLVQAFANPQTQLPAMVFWLLGSFAQTGFSQLALAVGAVFIAGGALILLRWRLNVLSLDGDEAATLGVPVAKLRWGVIAAAAALTASQVSVAGGIGWVGLVVPHLARFLVGAEHSKLLPAAALLGGAFLLGIDDLARSATDMELPIGLLTAVAGAPLFALVFWRTQKQV
jgi:iron complex transport system permease protein